MSFKFFVESIVRVGGKNYAAGVVCDDDLFLGGCIVEELFDVFHCVLGGLFSSRLWADVGKQVTRVYCSGLLSLEFFSVCGMDDVMHSSMI